MNANLISVQRRRIHILLLLIWLSAGCQSQGTPDIIRAGESATAAPASPTPALLLAQPTREPTPTLAPALATRDALPATVTPSPTPAPSVIDRLNRASLALQIQDYELVISELTTLLQEEGASLAPQQAQVVRYQLGLALLGDEAYTEAAATLEEYLAAAESESLVPFDPAASFHLARAYLGLDDCTQAIPAYERYLEVEPATAPYVAPLLADCHLALGDSPAAIAALEMAVDAPSHSLTRVRLYLRLGELAMTLADYQSAVAYYDAILELAQTEATKGQAHYLAGGAFLAGGETAAAYERFQSAIDDYPGSYSSYLALVALIEAGVAVDDWQRGLVDHHAGAHLPAIEAFERYISANSSDYRFDTHLLLAASYEALGDIPSALAQIDAYQVASSGDAAARATSMIRRAEMLARAGRHEEAVQSYQSFTSAFPNHPDAPEMAYRAAWLTAAAGDLALAASRYEDLAQRYPLAEPAPEALYRAGMSHWQLALGSGAPLTLDRLAGSHPAITAWEELAEAYPAHEFAGSALVWLMKIGPESAQDAYRQQALALSGASYSAYRARDLAAAQPAFSSPQTLELRLDASAQQEAEGWLRAWHDLPAGSEVAQLDPALAGDPRLALGQKLWALGLRDEAKLELESLRQSNSDNPLFCYQLALAFRDLGLYRSSIQAAASLLAASPDGIRQAPAFIRHLLYPVYYAPTIQLLAEDYGYDPLLQFALVRQESLFESFAISSATAKGLSQVMPATGADIAARLGWPDYNDEELYRPVVGLNFGAYYLDQQLDAFGGDVYAALAAYNGGPGNAARWKAQAPADPDLFLEAIDYAETRQYIQRIYVGYAIYRELYGATNE